MTAANFNFNHRTYLKEFDYFFNTIVALRILNSELK